MSAVQKTVASDQPVPMVVPLLPLAILEALRAQDRPEEILQDEDPTTSMPRRFGLTDVVTIQIERYREAVRKGRPVPADDVGDLFRLVLRRPDAREILHAAGRRAAQHFFDRRPGLATSMLGVLPRSAAAAAARRGTKKLLRRLHFPGTVEIIPVPWGARLFEPLTAGLDTTGTPCTFYSAAIEESFFLYTRERPQVSHSNCATFGNDYCEWVLAELDPDTPSSSSSGGSIPAA